MKSIHLTPALAVVALAVVIVISGGTAVAATLITGAQVADRSLTAVDIKRSTLTGAEVKDRALGRADIRLGALTGAEVLDRSLLGTDLALNSVTGAQVNESTLGAVPNASALGGVAANGYLRSTRVQSASVSILDAATPRQLIADARLGIKVSYESTARLVIQNTSATATLAGYGFGYYVSTLQPRSFALTPGESVSLAFEAAGTRYAQFVIRQRNATASSSPVATLTCGLDDASPGNAFFCVLVG